MHEVSIALAIVDEVCERAVAERIERIENVFVTIGTLTGVVPDALQFAWDLATEGTPASKSRLTIERVPLVIFCAACNAEQTIRSAPLPVCPKCGTPSSTILHGRELFVRAMEVPDDPSRDRRSAEYSSQEHHAGAGTARTV